VDRPLVAVEEPGPLAGREVPEDDGGVGRHGGDGLGVAGSRGDHGVGQPSTLVGLVERPPPTLILIVPEVELVLVDREDGPAGRGGDGMAIGRFVRPGVEEEPAPEVEVFVFRGLSRRRRSSPGEPDGTAIATEPDIPEAGPLPLDLIWRRRAGPKVLDVERLG